MSDTTDTTKTDALQVFHTFGPYRVYLTPDAWVITYQDVDFIRVQRIGEHAPGFILLVVEIITLLLVGRRTDLRDRWAMWHKDYAADADRVALELRGHHATVMEFGFAKPEAARLTQKPECAQP